MRSSTRLLLMTLGLLGALCPNATLRAQNLTSSAWQREGSCFYPAGDTLHCLGTYFDSDADHARVRLRALAAVRGPGSRCRNCVSVRSTLTVGPWPTRIRVVTEARGDRHNDVATSRGSGHVFASIETRRSDWYLDLNAPGAETLGHADSFEVCLRPGTHTLRAGITLDVFGAGQPGIDTFTTDFWSEPGRGMEVTVFNLGPAGACPPGPQSIGIFADLEGARCNIPAPIGTIGTFYVLAVGWPGPAEITGAEFRIDGFPSAWVATVTPSPQATWYLGNPLQAGCNVAFGDCQRAGAVLLCTVNFQVWSELHDVPLGILPPTWFCEPFCCVTWVLCDAPVYTQLCVPAAEPAAYLNGSSDPCATAARPSSWTRVKELFR